MADSWVWDETLYGGSAVYYDRGRLPYATGLVDTVRQHLGLDGRGRLLDVGCGPGTLTLLLAPCFEEAVGVDADQGMLQEADALARRRGVPNVRWVHARAEDLPGGLGTFRVAVFGQSFHWMQREQVARTVHRMLEPGGWFVHITDVKGERSHHPSLDAPRPPMAQIRALVQEYLGTVRRAGQSILPNGTPSGERDIITDAGFGLPRHLVASGGQVLRRTTDDVVAKVYSRSDSAPHLFGDRLAEFDDRLRRLLAAVSPSGEFVEVQPDTELYLWQKK